MTNPSSASSFPPKTGGTIGGYNEPAQPVTYEEKIKRSVFIANVSVCRNEEEAKDFLNAIISQHRDATHNCRAYILSNGGEYSSDDGEPSGTAGRPILNAIKRSGLVNVMVIVTRYFGGVKLGVRGLIDAYGETAAKALELAGSVERVMTKSLAVSLGYAAMGNVTRLLEGAGASGLSWEYGENVNVKAEIPVNMYEGLARELDELAARGIITKWESVSS